MVQEIGVGPSIQTAELDDNSVTLAKIAHGTNNNVIGFDGSGVPVDKAGGGATVSSQTDILTASVTTTSTTYVTSLLSIVIANRTDGHCLISATCVLYNNTTGQIIDIAIFDDGTTTGHDISSHTPTANYRTAMAISWVMALDGSTINLRWKVGANTGNLRGESSGSHNSNMSILEVS